ncbi:hypothetical protein BDA99DRAFT_498969 [Phascolomyces articulosus]|uniref:DH domain-containing protein n=1 Tax=Phascolomyces articulosus TaxID=60185 RepID=A0AAD5PHN6_9FUNG|nr:hypothetical protein BDA99DRAFT_498969 [Phascolomyces articulosus]
MSKSTTRKRNTWASSVSNQVLLSTPVHERSRQEAVFALIRNERHYRNELDTLQTRLVQPLYEFDRVDPQERATFIRSVFKNLPELRHANHKLVHALTERQKTFSSVIPTVSDVFSAHILPILDDYQDYCNNLPRATYLLTTHTQFPQQLTQTYWPLIKKPLEHLQRYPALLKAIMDATTTCTTMTSATSPIIAATPMTMNTTTTLVVDPDDEHPDNEVLQLCLEAIQLCLDNLKDQLETRKQLLDIEKWVGNTWQLDALERRIMHRCRATNMTDNNDPGNKINKRKSREGEIIVLDHVVLVLLPPVLFIPLPIVVCVPHQHHLTLAHPPRGLTFPVQLLDSSSEQLIQVIHDAQKELKQKQPTMLSQPPLASSTFESWTAAVRLPSSLENQQESLVVSSHHGVTVYPSREHILDIDVSGLATISCVSSSSKSVSTYLIIASRRLQLLLIYKIYPNPDCNSPSSGSCSSGDDHDGAEKHWKEQQPLVIENVLDGFHVVDKYVVYQDKKDMLVHLYNPRKRRTVKTIDVQSVRVSGFCSYSNGNRGGQQQKTLVMACDEDFILVDLSGQTMRRRIGLKEKGKALTIITPRTPLSSILGDGHDQADPHHCQKQHERLCYNRFVYTMDQKTLICEWEIRPKHVVYTNPYLLAFDQKQCVEIRHAETGALVHILYEERCKLIGKSTNDNTEEIFFSVQKDRRYNIVTFVKSHIPLS